MNRFLAIPAALALLLLCACGAPAQSAPSAALAAPEAPPVDRSVTRVITDTGVELETGTELPERAAVYRAAVEAPAAETPAPIPETPAPETPATPTPATPAPAETAAPQAQDPDTAQRRQTAESCVGGSSAVLYAAIGLPSSSDYASSCLGPGLDGNLYYDGFTVYTYLENGVETVRYVG